MRKNSSEIEEESSENPMRDESENQQSNSDNSLESDRIGLKFSISISKQSFQERKVAQIVSKEASVFMSAIVDFVVEELLYGGIEAAQKKGKRVIKPIHLKEGIVADNSLFHWLKKKEFAIPNNSTLKKEIFEVLRYERNFYDIHGNLKEN